MTPEQMLQTGADQVASYSSESRTHAQIVAHRGDPFRYRENTLPSFASAIEAGADRVELDVRTTSDGVSIVLHDLSLLRLWGQPLRSDQVTYPFLEGLGHADIRIPTLVQVLELLAGSDVGVLVDVLTEVDARAAYEAVASWRASASDPAAVSVHWCGQTVAMQQIRALDDDAVIYLATDTGQADPGLVAQLRPSFLNMEATLVSPEVVAAAHEQGLQISVWTLDDAWAIAAVLALGADSVTTNRPALARRIVSDDEAIAAGLAFLMASAGFGGGAVVAGDDASQAALSTLDLGRCATVARELGTWAAGYLREVSPATVETKAHGADLVTDVDLAIERRVRDVIAAEFPEHVVVGEEQGGEARAGVPTWYVDPVDGTTNFAHGLGFASFSLALAVDDVAVLGVVADPFRLEVLSAHRGGGASNNGVPLHLAQDVESGTTTDAREAAEASAGTGEGVPGDHGTSSDIQNTRSGIDVLVAPMDPLPGAVVLTEWAAHLPWPGMIQVLEALAGRYVTTRIMGSGTLSVTSVAAGRADGCVIGAFSRIDHLAALVLAQEAGARIYSGVDMHELPGSGIPTTGEPFLVAHPRVAQPLTEVVRSSLG